MGWILRRMWCWSGFGRRYTDLNFGQYLKHRIGNLVIQFSILELKTCGTYTSQCRGVEESSFHSRILVTAFGEDAQVSGTNVDQHLEFVS